MISIVSETLISALFYKTKGSIFAGEPPALPEVSQIFQNPFYT